MQHKINSKELIYQTVLHVVLMFFYVLDKHESTVEVARIYIFLQYSIGALIINYVLLPRFFYRKKYLVFAIYVLIIIAVLIAVEELIIEAIFYPDTRGKYFPGIFQSLIDVLPVLIILTGFKFAFDATKKQHELDEMATAVKESELQFLKTQINPHFLFNNLNNLYSYAIENSPKTPSIILELSSVLRYMLYDCKEDFVPLDKEIEHLKSFTALNELQIENRGVVEFKSDTTTLNYKIAPLILMVFIENAFKHSTASLSDAINIFISIKINEPGKLQFSCKNNFTLTANNQSLSKGIGLKNVKKRLEILYPNKHELIIKDNDTIFDVNLILDLT
jgi:hypothetical protein